MNVKEIRSAGLEAKWGKTRRGQPIMLVRRNPAGTWWMVTKGMLEDSKKVGWAEAFDRATALGDIFSLPV